MADKRFLLSIDGGGIRGIIPICALAALEKTTGRLTRDIFSFVAGTSTGAIITAAIAAGIRAEDMLESYRTLAGKIFKKGPLSFPKRVVTGHLYSVATLKQAISEQLGDKSGWVLNDCPVDVLISAKQFSNGKPWYLVRDKKGANYGMSGSFALVDCVAGSAAAPTFFEPLDVDHSKGWPPSVDALVDGGLGVTGNPVYQLCVEAFYYTDQYDRSNSTVVSLGTGRFLRSGRPRWIWPWLQWVLGELLESPGEQQTQLVQRHFKTVDLYRIDLNFTKLNPPLTRQISLDDTKSIDLLTNCGREFAATIDWNAILDASDRRWRVTDTNTEWDQYT